LSIQPIHDPLYQLPYQENGFRMLTVFAKCSHSGLESMIAGTPFELVSDEVMIYTASYEDPLGIPGHTMPDSYALGRYHESAVGIPVRYKGFEGKYFAYAYVDTFEALAAGREFGGFPKKGAAIMLEEEPDEIRAITERYGSTIIDARWTPSEKTPRFSQAFKGPQICVKVIPKATGPGALIRKVIVRRSVFTSLVSRSGDVSLNLGGSTTDGLYRLNPVEVTGALFEVGDHPFVWADIEEDF
jgi:acetoacetate decarboxylase